ncbi:hypothetical protein [Alicyclobacillus sp. ALC3]|uniref:hypothetical protein n=1 Tax=Alicyclobacillus sp. ALC3 TaxID=2796143 RepID=UPI00237912A5|nr:hypothetical protein [Alicyclobacillus sp. ALC3]WDL96909.1 hypothetical protein JC200_21960 [Alicyclobacillus sp. ALC3]
MQRILITDDVTDIRDGYAVCEQSGAVQRYWLDFYRLPDENTEHCDTCGKSLDKSKGEDFFVEDATGAHVYCEAHWPGAGETA